MQSCLLLAKDKDNDGYLQVHEIFGLNLREANLVVLSACDTALSKIYSGDDLVGLSRGFMYAGTPSLMATLWQVDDRCITVHEGVLQQLGEQGDEQARVIEAGPDHP